MWNSKLRNPKLDGTFMKVKKMTSYFPKFWKQSSAGPQKSLLYGVHYARTILILWTQFLEQKFATSSKWKILSVKKLELINKNYQKNWVAVMMHYCLSKCVVKWAVLDLPRGLAKSPLPPSSRHPCSTEMIEENRNGSFIYCFWLGPPCQT